MEIGLAISIIAVVFTIVNFVVARKDKATKDTKEDASKQSLIEYRLDELTKKVDKILDKLDNQESEVKKIVYEELEKHIKIYHKEN